MSDMKHDAGKLRWSLLRGSMTRALEGVLSVLEFGAKKYKEDSWLTVPNAKRRYRDALDRHLAAIDKGEQVDEESGKAHLFHVACNALFLAELECREQPKKIGSHSGGVIVRNPDEQMDDWFTRVLSRCGPNTTCTIYYTSLLGREPRTVTSNDLTTACLNASHKVHYTE